MGNKKTIVICDDTSENLNAAKKAAENFPGYDFVFTESAAEASTLASDPNVAGIITDLMFPGEKGCSIHEEVRSLSAILKGWRDHVRKWKVAYSRRQLETFEEFFKDRENSLETILSSAEEIISAAELRPFGISVFLTYQYSHQKPVVLITNMHRHGNGDLASLDAMAVLMPLMDSFMSPEEVRRNGHSSLTYIGSAQKERPEVWAVAIHKLCAQMGTKFYNN